MFKDVVNGLHPSHLNAARKVLNLEPQPEEPEDTTSYTQEQKTKDLSAFMAYSASLAFLAYTKPHEITPHRRFGIKESLTDGATIQHVRKSVKSICFRLLPFDQGCTEGVHAKDSEISCEKMLNRDR